MITIMKNLPLMLLVIMMLSIMSPCNALDSNNDWIKVSEGVTEIGSVQSYVDMNDIHRMSSDVISFKFVTNVPSVNASHILTILLNCKSDLYNIIDDRFYGGVFGKGEPSESISHTKDFVLVKGTQFEGVVKLVCSRKV